MAGSVMALLALHPVIAALRRGNLAVAGTDLCAQRGEIPAASAGMTVRGWSRELRWPPNVPTGTHITADLAIRFEQAFGSTADTWLRLQNAYDLAQTRRSAWDIKRIE